MNKSAMEPAMGKGLSEFEFEDTVMEDYDEDEDEEDVLITNYFEKRFLVKRKRLNNTVTSLKVNESSGGTASIEESMANLTIDEVFVKAKSTDLHEKLDGIIQIRKLISTSDNAPIDDLIKNEILPVLHECLSLPNSELQLETAWILTNIAAGNSAQTKAFHDASLHMALFKLLSSECDLDIANQALWALGNFMADNIGYCYQCISMAIMEPLTKQMKRFMDNIPFLRNVSWIMGQMSHLKDSPLFKETAWDLLPALWELSKQQDAEVRTNAIWGLSYLTDNDIYMLMNFDINMIKDVAPHLNSSSIELQAASLHFLANCASSNDEITNEIIACGVLKHLDKFLKHSNSKFVQETGWMISNILAGTQQQIDAVFKAGLMPAMIGLLENNDMKIKEKGIWAITNVPISGSHKAVSLLLDFDVIPPLCNWLMIPKQYTVQSVVEAINRIQEKCPDRREEIRQKILACGGLDQLRKLQSHESDAIQKHANQIIFNLFDDA